MELIEIGPTIKTIPKKIFNNYEIQKDQIKDLSSNLKCIVFTQNTISNIIQKYIEKECFQICREKISKDYILARFVEDGNHGILLHYKNDIIGLANFKFNRKTVHINTLCSKKQPHVLQGVPLGRILLDFITYHADQLMKNEKPEALELQATKNAILFYKKYGFQFKEKNVH